MEKTIEIAGLKCNIYGPEYKERIVYLLYPMPLPDEPVDRFAKEYGVAVVVVTGMDWESAFSPWPAKGVPEGSPDFKGDSPVFLKILQTDVIPFIESSIKVTENVERSLIGVSMSGLFALWQWIECATFQNIASLSGSFWYEGFMEWLKSQRIPKKAGKAFFLLGDKERKTNIKAFQSVEENTLEIVSLLRSSHIDVEYTSVPGNHYSDPLLRLSLAFKSLFGKSPM